MSKSTSSMSAEAEEMIRDVFAALNRNDVPGVVKAFDADIERIEPAPDPAAGIFRGIAAVTEHVRTARATWAEGTCEPRRIITTGDRIVVLTQVRVRLKTETDWREGRTADVFTFRNGKVLQWRTFFDERQGLDWAGVDASEAK